MRVNICTFHLKSNMGEKKMINKKISLILLLLSFFMIVGSVSACDDVGGVVKVSDDSLDLNSVLSDNTADNVNTPLSMEYREYSYDDDGGYIGPHSGKL